MKIIKLVLGLVVVAFLGLIFIGASQEKELIPEPVQQAVIDQKDVSEDQKMMSPEQKAMAKKWLVEFRAEKDKSLDPDVMNSPELRRTTIAKLDDLYGRAGKLFNNEIFSSCAMASVKLSGAWQSIDSLMSVPQNNAGRVLGVILFDVSDSGEFYSDCRAIIDDLK